MGGHVALRGLTIPRPSNLVPSARHTMAGMLRIRGWRFMSCTTFFRYSEARASVWNTIVLEKTPYTTVLRVPARLGRTRLQTWPTKPGGHCARPSHAPGSRWWWGMATGRTGGGVGE